MTKEKINLAQLREIDALTNMLNATGLNEKGYFIIAKGNMKRYKLCYSFDWMSYTELNEFLRGYKFGKENKL